MKMKSGFTMIELMIVIAIISIIAALAIPNLMQARIRANEATAVTALKNYCAAQVTFQVGRQGRVADNTGFSATSYCIVYPNLFYGNPTLNDFIGDTTMNLALISRAHADAWVDGVLTGSIWDSPTTHTPTPTPYQGYQFANPDSAIGEYFQTEFAQIAVPAKSSSTGNNAYWVGVEGTVYSQGLGKGLSPASTAVMSTPDDDYSGWLNL